MNDSWKLDRKPTTAERVVGIAGAALLCAAGSASLWFSVVVLRDEWVALATGTLAALFAFVLFRFISTQAEKPPRPEVLATAQVIVVVSPFLLVASIFVHEWRARIVLFSLGVTGLVGGISNLARARKEPGEPLPSVPRPRDD